MKENVKKCTPEKINSNPREIQTKTTNQHNNINQQTTAKCKKLQYCFCSLRQLEKSGKNLTVTP